MQEAYFRSHAWSVNQRVQISQGLLIDVPNHQAFTHIALRTKSKWLLIGSLLLSKNLCFLYA
jgi:hypothetical protein